MKKITTLLLLAAIFVMSFGTSTVIAEEKDYSYYLNFINKLGIAEDVSGAKSVVTRGAFADYVSRILAESKNETNDSFFGDDNYNDLILPGENLGIFEDVPESSEYYNGVREVYRRSVMKGMGNGEFQPDSEISFKEVATAMVRLLGYNIQVKDNDYLSVAEGLGLFKGISYTADKKISLEELALVFYNCWDIDVMELKYEDGNVNYSIKNGTNIFEAYMSVYKYSGQLEKNPFTSIYGNGGAGKDNVIISGVEYIDKADYEFYDYIGRDVEFFCKEDESADEKTILWGYLSGKDEAITVGADDVVGFENYRFTYYNGKREVSKNVEQNAVLICNGTYKAGFTTDDFDFDSGDVTIIRPKNASGYSIITVNNYKSMRVTHVDAAKSVIHAQGGYNEEASAIKMDSDTIEPWRVRYYMDNAETDLKSITDGMVIDVLQSDGYLKIVAVNKAAYKLSLASIGNEDDGAELIFADGTKYTMPYSYYDSMKRANAEPKIGNIYNIALNSFGKIAYMECVKEEPATGFVYIIRVIKDDELDKIGYIKYMNDKGDIILTEIQENAKFTNQERTSIKIKNSDTVSKIVDKDGAPYEGVAKIEKDKDGSVTQILLPADDGKSRDNVFGTMVYKKNVVYCGSPSYKHFEGLMFDDNKIIFNVDKNKEDENKRYKICDSTRLRDGTEYNVSGYNFYSDSSVANCIVVNGTIPEKFMSGDSMYVIDKVYEDLYGDDEAVTMVKAYSLSQYSDPEELTFPTEGDSVTKAETFFDEKAGVKLKKGDIIYAEIEDNYIVRAVLVYRIFNEDGESNLYATSGVYDPENGVKTNPYGINEDFKIQATNNLTSIRGGGIDSRFFAGSVYDFELSKYITYTSQPVREGKKYDTSKSSARYFTETLSIPYRYIAIDVDGKNINVRKGTTSDIVTYKNAGAGCTELFLRTSFAVIRQMVLINRR